MKKTVFEKGRAFETHRRLGRCSISGRGNKSKDMKEEIVNNLI